MEGREIINVQRVLEELDVSPAEAQLVCAFLARPDLPAGDFLASKYVGSRVKDAAWSYVRQWHKKCVVSPKSKLFWPRVGPPMTILSGASGLAHGLSEESLADLDVASDPQDSLVGAAPRTAASTTRPPSGSTVPFPRVSQGKGRGLLKLGSMPLLPEDLDPPVDHGVGRARTLSLDSGSSREAEQETLHQVGVAQPPKREGVPDFTFTPSPLGKQVPL